MYWRPSRKPSQPLREVPTLDVAVHHLERSLLQPGDEARAARDRGIRLATREAPVQMVVQPEIGVHAQPELNAVVGLAGRVFALEVVGGEPERLHEAPAIDDAVAPRAGHFVGLKGRVAGDLEVRGPRARGAEEEHRDRERRGAKQRSSPGSAERPRRHASDARLPPNSATRRSS